MSELLPLENEKDKYEYYNNILIIKDSIKSDLIKKMLEEEDIKEKEDKNKNITKNSNKKKTFNSKESKDKNNFYYYPIIKIYPKSRTMRNLLIEKPKKKNSKNNHKNNINEKGEKEEKNYKINQKSDNNNLNLNIDNPEIKLDSKDKYYEKIDIVQRNLSPIIQKQKIQFINEDNKENTKKEIYHSEEKPKRQNKELFTTNESISIKKEEPSQKFNSKLNKYK